MRYKYLPMGAICNVWDVALYCYYSLCGETVYRICLHDWYMPIACYKVSPCGSDLRSLRRGVAMCRYSPWGENSL